MNVLINQLFPSLRNVLEQEEGQDLVEYALVVALIAFGCVTGMGFLATGINQAFSNVAAMLATDI